MFKLDFVNKYLANYTIPIIISIIFSLLAVVFSVLTFSTVYPFLQLIFDNTKIVDKAVPFTLSKDALENNLHFLFSEIIRLQGKSKALLYISLSAMLLYFFKNLLSYLSFYILAPVRNGILYNIRNDIYHKLLILPISFYRFHKKGDIISRATNDAQELDESILKPFQAIFIQAVTIIFYLTALFLINYKLTVFVMILLPIGAFIISRISKILKKTANKLQSKQGALLSIIEETISGLRIIKAYNAIDFSNEKFKKNNEIFTKIKNIIYRRTDLASPMSEVLGTIIFISTFLYGGSLIISNESTLDGASFFLYLALFINIINPSKTLTTAFYQIQKGKASIERIKYIFEAKEVIEESPEAIHIKSFNEGISFRNLSFSYETSKYVLKNINLDIAKGKSIAIVGPSGAGKSTLVDLIPRFYDATEGNILIDNIPINQIGIDSLRALTGIVSQETILFNDTIFNNIAFGNENVSMESVIDAAKIANAHDFIIQMENGYNSIIGDSGSLLSGGQRQRLNIARAVLKNPPILILDEATSALDTESERLVQDAIDKVMKGRTTIAIAHRLSTIYNMDEIIVLNNGIIEERGNHQTLISKDGLYKKLHDLQSFR
jgi:subfamily B ATP-binding cassette protein MsbA